MRAALVPLSRFTHLRSTRANSAVLPRRDAEPALLPVRDRASSPAFDYKRTEDQAKGFRDSSREVLSRNHTYL